MSKQTIITAQNDYIALDQCFQNSQVKRVLLVCGSSINRFRIGTYFDGIEQRLGIKVVRFSSFKPNPLYESVVEGVEVFRKEECDTIVAVGGGSAMDVAKCIKLYSNMDMTKNYLKQEIIPNDVKLFAVPTTAGTGSEATKFAVIYYKGEKRSISNYSCIPSMVLIDVSVLKTLPLYHKKATMMDALCHSIEAFWSVNSTDESKEYSRKAITLLLENKDGYLGNEDVGNANMLLASNYAGKAINITQTTAGHAMCYKLTSIYGISHGHAAALCVTKLWPYMIKNTDKCTDPRGKEYLDSMFEKLAMIFVVGSSMVATEKFQQIFDELQLDVPVVKDNKDFDILKNSVNPIRLKNNPVALDIETIDFLYHQILGKD